MTPQIILAPCSSEEGKENLQKSIENLVETSTYDDYISVDLPGPVGIWGTGEQNSGKWERIKDGDFILFYTGDYNYEYAGRIIGKEINEDLAVRLWVDEDNELAGPIGERSWKYLLFVSDIEEVDIDSEDLHRYAGYVRMFPMQFKFLPEKGVEKLVEEYGTVENYVYD